MATEISSFKIGGTMSIPNSVVVLLYSSQQKAFHTESFVDYLKSNIEDFKADRPSGYALIGMFETREDCDKVFGQVLNIRDARQQAKEFLDRNN